MMEHQQQLSERIQRAILEHARSTPDAEVCGFVYPDDYVPLRNRSDDPRQFEADPRDVASALSKHGEPLAVFHTHPNRNPAPSPDDLTKAYYSYSTRLIGILDEQSNLLLFQTER